MTSEPLRAGQRVRVAHNGSPLPIVGVYQIVRAMPGQPLRYLIKSESEAFERIIDESQLEICHAG